jgi:CRP/FNR family transcriptional regulator, cyclic AMP receptor protein
LSKPLKTVHTKPDFNPHVFLTTVGKGRKMLPFGKKDTIFAQGDSTDGLFFIQNGKVRLSVVSEGGKEATLAILGQDDFFGEGGLSGQSLRMSSATAMTDCVLLNIDKNAMTLAMRLEPKLSAIFIKYLLKRNIRFQDDLVDQLFNSSEKRLARVLMLMAHFGKKGVSEMLVPRLSQGTLAEMVGTTRSRVSFFMNRFRKLGFINYDSGNKVNVHTSLLSVVLDDDTAKSVVREAKSFAGNGENKLEPPAKPGSPPDKELAKRPSLSLPGE